MFVDEIKKLYDERKVSSVRAFVEKYADDNTVTDGTCVGEIYKGKDGLYEIIKNDLKYWYDLKIFDEYEEERYGAYIVLHLHALSILAVRENTARYKSFVTICEDTIAVAALTPRQKAAEIEYSLASVLSSRSKKCRKNPHRVGITAVFLDGKIRYLNYFFEKTFDDADTFLGVDAELDAYYKEAQKNMSGGDCAEIKGALEGQGYSNVLVNIVDGELFYALATMQETRSLDDRLTALFASFKHADDYQTLYDLRLKIAYLNKLYAYGEKPEAVVRFNGFKEEFLHCGKLRVNYPHWWYVESN